MLIDVAINIFHRSHVRIGIASESASAVCTRGMVLALGDKRLTRMLEGIGFAAMARMAPPWSHERLQYLWRHDR